jgi:hypothetical protein
MDLPAGCCISRTRKEILEVDVAEIPLPVFVPDLKHDGAIGMGSTGGASRVVLQRPPFGSLGFDPTDAVEHRVQVHRRRHVDDVEDPPVE